MGQIGFIIAGPGKLAIAYAQRLLKDVTPSQFARFARPGNVEVKSNHPAFVFGHLSMYPLQVITHLGKPTDSVKPPAGYEPLFKNGVECRDDPDGMIYPKMEQIVSFYLSSYETAINELEAADDATLTKANPMEGRMSELFPLMGGMLAFYISGHQTSHLGQVSAWRRMMGLPAA
jgi:hypothetical protein